METSHLDLSSSLLFIFVGLMLTLILIYSMLRYRLVWLPNSVLVIVIGLVVGAIVRYFFSSSPQGINGVFFIEPEGFFMVMLPPVIVDAGLTLNKRYFFQNMVPILLLSVLGTLISTFVIGLGLWGCFGGFSDMSLLQALMYGALISAVDPVATLAIFHQLDVSYTLHMLVFGESVLNDAASLVLYQTLEAFEETSATVGSIFANIGIFVLILIGSMLTGAVCGVLSALFFKKIDVNNFPSLEMSIYFVMSYIPYLIAESSGMSGIIALLFYGIVCSHYTFFCISPTSQFSTPHMFRMLAYIAETMIFLYLGVAAFVYPQDFSITFTASALVRKFSLQCSCGILPDNGFVILIGIVQFWCLVGRALNIFPLCFITNVFHAGEIFFL